MTQLRSVMERNLDGYGAPMIGAARLDLALPEDKS
jgi:hypothetical protein